MLQQLGLGHLQQLGRPGTLDRRLLPRGGAQLALARAVRVRLGPVRKLAFASSAAGPGRGALSLACREGGEPPLAVPRGARFSPRLGETGLR